MKLYKYVSDGYIVSVGSGGMGDEITESEYNEIMTAISNKPHRDGYDYRLKTDLTWEEYESPTPEPDPTEEVSGDEVLDALEEIL